MTKFQIPKINLIPCIVLVLALLKPFVTGRPSFTNDQRPSATSQSFPKFDSLLNPNLPHVEYIDRSKVEDFLSSGH